MHSQNESISKSAETTNHKEMFFWFCAGITREAVSPTEAKFGIVPNEKKILYF